MDALVALILPFIFLWIMTSMLRRLLLPGRAGEVFVGVVARDVFWIVLRALATLLFLPFVLLRLFASARPSSLPRRRRRRRRRARRGP